MSIEASQEQTEQGSTQGEQQSQAVQGSETQTQETVKPVEGQTQQESVKQQPPATIPYERFSEKAREAAELKRVNQQLLQALGQGGVQQRQPQAPVDDDPEPKQEAFIDYEEWRDARSAWHGRKAGREAYQQERQKETQAQQVKTQAAELQKMQGNYQAKTAAEGADFHAAAQDLRLGDTLWAATMGSEIPGAIVKHFLANPAETQRVTQLPQWQQLIEFGKLETRLAGSNGQPAQVSKMPKPMTPVGSGKSGNGEYTQDKVTAMLYPH